MANSHLALTLVLDTATFPTTGSQIGDNSTVAELDHRPRVVDAATLNGCKVIGEGSTADFSHRAIIIDAPTI